VNITWTKNTTLHSSCYKSIIDVEPMDLWTNVEIIRMINLPEIVLSDIKKGEFVYTSIPTNFYIAIN
jgi:hypothetical protein